MYRLALTIEGMTCPACAAHIEAALNGLAGVHASVSYETATATIDTDAGVDRSALARAVQQAGYGVGGDTDRASRRPSARETNRHIAIIGSGSGAFAAAIRAAEAGARVTLIEHGTLGGTCVNVGCVPSKIALRAAEIAHRRTQHPFAGIPDTAGGPVARHQLVDQIRGRVSELSRAKYEGILEHYDAIEVVRGHAHFADPDILTIETPDGATKRLTADRFLVATGASPSIPPIPGLADTPWWDSTDALFSEAVPQHLAIIGGSFVACELAQAFRRLGSEVTVLARSRLASDEAPEVGDALESAFVAEGIRVLRATQAHHVAHDGQRFQLALAGEPLVADRLLIATGRTPNTGAIGLDRAGVATTEHGAIRVDNHLHTANEQIYAVGDCADLPQLVYVAAAAGTRAAINMTGGDARLDLSVLARVIFTDPQAAAVGLDEAQARRAGIEPISRRLDLDQVPRALANFDTKGFIRLIAEADTSRLVGARVVAHNGGEVIQAAALAIRAGMTVTDLAGELFPYLTLSEGLKLCAQTFDQDVTMLSCCAG
jgi:mercuric reductase